MTKTILAKSGHVITAKAVCFAFQVTLGNPQGDATISAHQKRPGGEQLVDAPHQREIVVIGCRGWSIDARDGRPSY